MLLEAQAGGYRVEGLEISADAAVVANRKIGFDAVRVGTTANTDLPDGLYDICILADVIEHDRDSDGFSNIFGASSATARSSTLQPPALTAGPRD